MSGTAADKLGDVLYQRGAIVMLHSRPWTIERSPILKAKRPKNTAGICKVSLK